MIAKIGTIATLAGALLLTAIAGAQADKRVALVIGNSAYRNVPPLPNPVNDAAAMALLFKNAGFDSVDLRRDVGISDLRRACASSRTRARTPTSPSCSMPATASRSAAPITSFRSTPSSRAISTSRTRPCRSIASRRRSSRSRRLRLVILDACRDNPFAKSMKRSIGTRSVGRGLAKVEPATSDTLIAFAAKAGSVATDGDGADSPFTTALVKHLTTPGLDLRIALGKVRDEVLEATHRKQEPFVYGSLGGSTVALVPHDANSVANAAPATPSPPPPRIRMRRHATISISPIWSAPHRPGTLPGALPQRLFLRSRAPAARKARRVRRPRPGRGTGAGHPDTGGATRSLGDLAE